jgi:hypothetical protein
MKEKEKDSQSETADSLSPGPSQQPFTIVLARLLAQRCQEVHKPSTGEDTDLGKEECL